MKRTNNNRLCFTVYEPRPEHGYRHVRLCVFASERIDLLEAAKEALEGNYLNTYAENCEKAKVAVSACGETIVYDARDQRVEFIWQSDRDNPECEWSHWYGFRLEFSGHYVDVAWLHKITQAFTKAQLRSWDATPEHVIAVLMDKLGAVPVRRVDELRDYVRDRDWDHTKIPAAKALAVA